MAEKLEKTLAFRISDEEKAIFMETCGNYDRQWSDMLREIIAAFNAGKLTITVPKSKLNTIKGLHKCQ